MQPLKCTLLMITPTLVHCTLTVFELQTQFETGYYEFVTALISPLPLPPLFNVYTATTNMEGTGRGAKKKDTQISKRRSAGRKVYNTIQHMRSTQAKGGCNYLWVWIIDHQRM